MSYEAECAGEYALRTPKHVWKYPLTIFRRCPSRSSLPRLSELQQTAQAQLSPFGREIFQQASKDINAPPKQRAAYLQNPYADISIIRYSHKFLFGLSHVTSSVMSTVCALKAEELSNDYNATPRIDSEDS